LSDPTYRLQPVGWVESPLTDRAAAPKQGDEGAPLARVDFRPEFCEAAGDLKEGDEVLLLTWLHRGRRDVLSVHPRGDMHRSRKGVFATRSPDRPNSIGLHAVVIEAVEETPSRSTTSKRSTALPFLTSNPSSAQCISGDELAWASATPTPFLPALPSFP
jgi:tRNA-Thr(GGU) m(6)t(6)A37 methyltransferase TsaA